MEDIVILGSSGFAKEVFWLLEEANKAKKQWNVLGFVDEGQPKEPVRGFGVIGNDGWLARCPRPINAVCGLGSAALRRKVVEKLRSLNKRISFPSIVSPRAILSPCVNMGEGCIICAGAVIAMDVALGNFVMVNHACTIGHDSTLQDFVTVNPGTNVSGNVHISSDCEIGTGASIIPGRRLGPGTVVGAGSVIIRDVPGRCTVAGNPGRILEKPPCTHTSLPKPE